MSDIVERLRKYAPTAPNLYPSLYMEAAIEIERLRAERNEWKAKWLALDEFARRELERRALGQKS